MLGGAFVGVRMGDARPAVGNPIWLEGIGEVNEAIRARSDGPYPNSAIVVVALLRFGCVERDIRSIPSVANRRPVAVDGETRRRRSIGGSLGPREEG